MAPGRKHLLDAVSWAIEHRQQLLDMCFNAVDDKQVKAVLQTDYGMSEHQADVIVSLPFRRITEKARNDLKQELEDISLYGE